MPLSSGVRLGPYEILSPLGAGGMGDVYRARDPRLGRTVALKVLREALSSDPSLLQRFEHEARAAGALNHPHVLAVYDVGTYEGGPYIVSELLDGESLRERLRGGGLAVRKAVEYGIQVAKGLAAAHSKGITHRDLKPENVFLTRDGHAKILDFGLAKLSLASRGDPDGATASFGTQPGVVMGTVGYMSPEQARGLPADPRSDIFALGAVLYEMLSNRRAFHGDTAAEALASVLKDDPPDLRALGGGVPISLERVVRRCMEKRPEDRFQSAHDVAFALEASFAPDDRQEQRSAGRQHGRAWAGGAVLVLSLAAAALVVQRNRAPAAPPSFAQLTFRRGDVLSARFAPDGQTVIYSAAWEGRPSQLFSTRIGSREFRPLGLPDGVLLSISATGEMALRLGPTFRRDSDGVLARASLAGGAPRELARDVSLADWTPDGETLCVVRHAAGKDRIECPIGTLRYESRTRIQALRALPGEQTRLAIVESGPRSLEVAIVDLEGRRVTLSSGWADIWDLGGWSARTREIWFAASRATGEDYALYAVTLNGRERLVARVPGDFFLNDVAPSGRVLLTRGVMRWGMLGLVPGESGERDLSWLDYSVAADLSADGRLVLFSDQGSGAIYVRGTDGSPAVRLGEGLATSLSPDGLWALGRPSTEAGDYLTVLPTGAGETHRLRQPSLRSFRRAAWLPDGKRFVTLAEDTSGRERLYLWGVEDAAPRALSTAEMGGQLAVSPDGRWVVVGGAGTALTLVPVGGGETRGVPGARPKDQPLRWSRDGWLYLRVPGDRPASVEQLHVSTGQRRPWRSLMPADPTGVQRVFAVIPTPDGTGYVYTFMSSLGTLYLADGFR